MGVDSSGTLQDLVDKFNEEHKGEFQVRYREMPADTGQYFDQLRTELQAAASEIDVIGGDVIWPAQFAANGWILDVSDRFPESERQQFLPAPWTPSSTREQSTASPGSPTRGCSTTARTCWRRPASPSLPGRGTR
jgi:ABC-type glycerol-3-phosphate transport system substrate-binding protein